MAQKEWTRLLEWFARERDRYPFRRGRTPYQIWVTEVALQQTRIDSAWPILQRFLRVFPDLATLARAEEHEVLQAFKGLGYYNRARNLLKGARLVLQQYGGLPKSYDQLLRIPSMGPYTAAAVASIAFGERVPAVDGNAERVLARVYGFAYNKGSAELKHKAYDALAQVMQLGAYPPGDINEAVMQLGQTLCTRSAPECGGCPLAPACLARKQGRQKQLPKSKPSTTKVDVLWYLYVLRKGGRVAVHPLNRLPLLSRQVGFPGRILYVSGKQAGIWHDSLPQPWGEMLYQRLCALEPSAQGRHAITHHRIQVKLFVGYAQELERSLGAELLSLQDLLWVNENEIENQLISSLMTKAWFKFFPFYA